MGHLDIEAHGLDVSGIVDHHVLVQRQAVDLGGHVVREAAVGANRLLEPLVRAFDPLVRSPVNGHYISQRVEPKSGALCEVTY